MSKIFKNFRKKPQNQENPAFMQRINRNIFENKLKVYILCNFRNKSKEWKKCYEIFYYHLK